MGVSILYLKGPRVGIVLQSYHYVIEVDFTCIITNNADLDGITQFATSFNK